MECLIAFIRVMCSTIWMEIAVNNSDIYIGKINILG